MELVKKYDDKSLLEKTILNNILKGKINDEKNLSVFSEYFIRNIKKFESRSENENLSCNFEFLKFS